MKSAHTKKHEQSAYEPPLYIDGHGGPIDPVIGRSFDGGHQDWPCVHIVDAIEPIVRSCDTSGGWMGIMLEGCVGGTIDGCNTHGWQSRRKGNDREGHGIQIRNQLFEGDWIDKPPLAKVIYMPMAIYICPQCGANNEEDDCGVIGAETVLLLRDMSARIRDAMIKPRRSAEMENY